MIPSEKMYKKGTRVWVPHPTKVWESAIILEDYETNQNRLFIQTDDSRETHILNIKSADELPPLYLLEDSSLGPKRNLKSLTVIHEATILDKLRSRFEQGCGYSYCGVSTIALNPYHKTLDDEIDKIYIYQSSNLSTLDPHIYGVAENVYTKLERESCDQTIIFTGESGSGKSVNAELAILYLTTISAKDNEVKDKILASSIVLQAFGNASTVINDDSSRFGKFIEMQYDKHHHIIGAVLKSYNLDRSKVILKGKEENIFNIFYYLYAAREKLSYLQLNECQFNYLDRENNIESYDENNKKYFDRTNEAFKTLGFSEKEQSEIFRILAVLLHLQNIKFKKLEVLDVTINMESCVLTDLNHLKIIGKLLGLDDKALKIMRKWMCYKRVLSEQDEILQPMDPQQAIKARDALVKFLYNKLFNWLVTRMNASFRSPCHVQSFIGILDMQGFEKLDYNVFEQFCINYIDEKVQQLFIETIFKIEQEEYVVEEIGWTLIDFTDNLPCVELIEGKSGILEVLEEETKMSSDDNLSWLESLHSKFEKVPHFQTYAENVSNFTIRHFLTPVHYNATDFLTKNYENITKEQLEFMKETKNELLNKLILKVLLKLNPSKVKRRSGGNKRASSSFRLSRKTVITKLRESLTTLTDTLSQTKPYFVRCIKSNDEKKSFNFVSLRVAEQLRSFNILETVKISRAGYFHQRCYKEFIQRYHCLSQFEDLNTDNKPEICRKILEAYVKNKDVKFGKTKVFIREDSIEHLERLRAQIRQHAIVIIQKSVRRYLQQKRYNNLRMSVCEIQRYARAYLVRQRIQAFRDRIMLENVAATKIQACFRRYLHHRCFQYVKPNLPMPQEYSKHPQLSLAPQYTEDTAAIEIQKHVRSMLARRRCERILRNIVIVQSYVRRFLAMVRLKKLKHQKDLRAKVLNNNVEKKVDLLQQKINCLMGMHLCSEDVKTMQLIINDKICLQAKIGLLNDLMLNQIRKLQHYRVNQQPYNNSSQIQHHSTSIATQLVNTCTSQQYGIGGTLMPDEQLGVPCHDKILYQRLFDSLHQFDRDAKKLQRTAGISDAEISRLINSHRESLRSLNDDEIATGDTKQKVNAQDSKVLDDSFWDRSYHCKPFSSSSNTKSLQNSDPDSYPTLKNQRNTLVFPNPDPEEEHKQKFLKKKCSILFDDDDSGDEVIDDNKTLDNKIQYSGMFAFDLKATESVIDYVTDIYPSSFDDLPQSRDLPAKIVMMCIRYTDYKNDYPAALSLVWNFIKKVKLGVEMHPLFHRAAFWLLNTHQLLNFLKQYSKRDEENSQYNEFHAGNTARQNQQRLRNFDLRDTWMSLEQTCQYLTNWIIKEMKSCIVGLHSVTALLYTEGIYDVNVEYRNGDDVQKINQLFTDLTRHYDTFVKYLIDRKIVAQIFKSVFEYLSFITLNNILSRSHVCSVRKGMEIRGHIRSLERWIINRELSSALSALSPLIQATRFIQLQPICYNDIYNIQRNYSKLSCSQILKLLELYNANCSMKTPKMCNHDSVLPEVIELLKHKLEDRQDLDDTVLVDAEDCPIRFPFRHSRVRLENVELPQSWHFPMLRKL